MNIVKDILKWITNLFRWQDLRKSLPWLLLIAGVIGLTYSIFGTFEDTRWKMIWKGIGQTVLAGGVFAVLLKSMQISGVFEDALEKIIFEPRFLKNRKDLPEYWAKLSKELFRNKFPKISDHLLKDITEVYFPTAYPTYYDSLEHIIRMRSLGDDRVEVEYTVKLDIISSPGEPLCDYTFSNNMSFDQSEDEVKYEFLYLKVNGKEQAIEPVKTIERNVVTRTFPVKLEGNDLYKVERSEKKTYSLDKDNIIYYRTSRLTHNFTLVVEHPQNIIIDLKKCGTIKDFRPKREAQQYKEYICEGVIYPHQGYIITFNLA